MADRYTKKDAEQCAGFLAKKLNKPIGKCWKQVDGKNVAQVGCWQYSHNSIYGGGMITEIANESGGEKTPFGSKRLKPEHFCDAMRIAEKAVDISKER